MNRAEAWVDLDAITGNAAVLRSRLPPGTALCAVVKANGYGHGAVHTARAAQRGGATWLATAAASEAAELRGGGLEGRILVMGALHGDELADALAARADVVAWDPGFVAELSRRAERRVGVHVKLDTGMGRLGTREQSAAIQVAELVSRSPNLQLAGLMTHFATSDDDPEFMAEQLRRFVRFASGVRAPGVIAHAANSGAVLREPETHLDMARCGIALYGCDPMHRDPADHGLQPALELRSYVAAVKPISPGQSVGYGRRFVAEEDSWMATVPIGYADGVRRAFGGNLEVLIRGRRHPVVGTISMDNLTVDLGRERDVVVGDEVMLIGRQGDERISAEELAGRIGTINYEIVCGLGSRVRRRYQRSGTPCD